MTTRRGAFLAVVMAACSGPGSGSDAGVDPGAYTTVVELPATPNRNVDVLFVIDDSPSMADKQANLAANFPNFVNVLNTLPGGFPDVHLGVVTTDMGTKGSNNATPGPAIGQIGNGGCSGTGKSGNLQTSGATISGTFISDIKQADGSRLKNYTGDLATVFAQMARVGMGGCGFEQPLAAMIAALNNNPMNVGFLRPEALLAVMFVTDEDDCSLKDASVLGPESATLGPLQSFRCARFGVTCAQGGLTSDAMNTVGPKSGCADTSGSAYIDEIVRYKNFLTGIKADPTKVVVGAIMGTTAPYEVILQAPPGGGTAVTALAHSCTYQGANGVEVADPPVRLQALLDQFPNRSTASTICQQDLTGGLEGMASLLTFALGTPCVREPLVDTDAATAGLQPDCIVEDVVDTVVTPIPGCGPTPGATCWRLVSAPATCPAADHLSLTIDRAETPSPQTITRMRCRVQ